MFCCECPLLAPDSSTGLNTSLYITHFRELFLFSKFFFLHVSFLFFKKISPFCGRVIFHFV